MRLKEYYLGLLGNPQAMINLDKTAVHIVLMLWKIKVEAKEYYFSDFFSQKDTEFILQFAHLLDEISTLQQKCKEERSKVKGKNGNHIDIVDEEKESKRVDQLRETIYSFKKSNLKTFVKIKERRNQSLFAKW